MKKLINEPIKTERLQVRLTPGHLYRLRILSRSSHTSMANLIAFCIDALWSSQCKIPGWEFLEEIEKYHNEVETIDFPF